MRVRNFNEIATNPTYRAYRAFMPTPQTLERFIAKVETNKHDEAIEAFYTPDASMRENQSPPCTGRANHVAREKSLLARAKSVTSQCIRPAFQSGDLVVIRWKFRFVWLDNTVTEMEELAYQRWDGEKIADEQFFYDPVQRQPNSQ